jgi:fumarate hydratase class II
MTRKQATLKATAAGPTTQRNLARDELGEVELPEGSEYGAHTFRALKAIAVSSTTIPDVLMISIIRIKRACALAHAELGTLDPKIADAISQACEKILAERIPTPARWRSRFPLDAWQSGAGTNWNMNANEVIAHVANELLMGEGSPTQPIRAHDHVNRGQSSNSVIPAAIRIALLLETRELLHELHQAARLLEERAPAWEEYVKPARTHLQDAVPTTFAREVRAWAKALERCRHWIGESRTELESLALGAGAAGTSLAVPEGFGARVTELLAHDLNAKGLKDAKDDGADFLQSLFAPTHTHAQLELLACELHRICTDIRLLTSGPRCGLGEITLQTHHAGSSMMPGKTNPSIPELISQISFRVQGNHHTILLAFQNGQLDLNVMTPVLATAALESLSLLTHGIRLLRTEVLETLVPNRERMAELHKWNSQQATALLLRYGHKRVGEWVKQSLTEKIPVEEVIPPAIWEEAQTEIKRTFQAKRKKAA